MKNHFLMYKKLPQKNNNYFIFYKDSKAQSITKARG